VYDRAVDTLDAWRVLARGLDRAAFAARHPYPFLVKRPLVASSLSEDDWEERIGYVTRHIEADAAREPDLLDELGPVAAEWLVAPVHKRPQNPYPERISVGRAKNCDVVLRFPSVSKLHGYFLLAVGRVAQLMDAGSANGTWRNDERLAPNRPVAVVAGDRLRLGALDLELLDAGALHALL
jgi:hypothetical protein